MGVVLGAGLLFRLVYHFEYRDKSIFYDNLMLDAQVYDVWAQTLALGHWWGGEVFHHAPLYPYLLALFYRLLGHHLLPVYLFQLILGLVFLVLVYRLGRWCASAWVGLVAAILLLLYAPLPFFETKLMPTTLALTLSVAAMAALVGAWERGGILRWLGAGAVVGSAALAHPASLILVPVFAVAVLVRFRHLPNAGAFVAGAAISVAPATLHNFAADGSFVPVSSQGGITFLQGNMPDARGLYRPVPGFTGSPVTQSAEQKTLAQRELGQSLNASEVSHYWFSRALEQIREQPGRTLKVWGFKLIRWVSSYEYSTEYNLAFERRQIRSLWVAFVPFGFLLVGAAAGIVMGWRTFCRLSPVYLYLIATAAPPLIFYVSSRYRIPVVPALAILSGVAIERWVACLRVRGLKEALPFLAVILVVGSATLLHVDRDHLLQEANVHYLIGNIYFHKSDTDRAIEAYKRALRFSDAEYYRMNLGLAYAQTGQYEKAIEQFKRVTQRNPGFAKAYLHGARALVAMGREDEALMVYRIAMSGGLRDGELEVQLGIGASTPSVAVDLAAVQRAVEVDPIDASLRNRLGFALQEVGRSKEAIEQYRQAMLLNPRYDEPRFNLGVLFQSLGRHEGALDEFEVAAQLNPKHVAAHLGAASILLNRGDHLGARNHFLAVLEVEPDHPQALDGLSRIEGMTR